LSSKQTYLVAISTWYAAFGMQSVVFAWLVTMLLREPAERVGLAQMTILLPGMLLILLAGAIADRVGLRRQALWSQLFAALTPLLLIYFLYHQALSFAVMICYALLMGLAQAFLTPARDGLLNHVAGDNVQRMVVLASLCQFGFQIIGYSLAGFADTVGPIYILSFQSLLLLMGCWALVALKEVGAPTVAGDNKVSVLKDLREGAAAVMSNRLLRAVMVQNVAMGIFFMGSFIVAFPLVLREVFNGSSADLASLNAFNSLGLVLTIAMLLRIGHIARAGRALILAQFIGSIVLLFSGLVEQQAVFIFTIFLWGVCGGMAMPMSRTIMQQTAPPALRARVMSFYSFSFMGAGPIGALWAGYMADLFGPQLAIVISSMAMASLVLLMAFISPLWRSTMAQSPQ
jgi:MFS family permease